jgi:hypothetical protein
MMLDALRDPLWVGIGAIGTLAAVIVALGAVVADRRARTAADRMSQARRVSAWVDGSEITMPDDPTGQRTEAATYAVLANSSDEPVYRLLAWLVVYPAGEPATGEQARNPRYASSSEPAAYGVVPPGTYEIDLPEFTAGMLKKPAVEISFTDAGGRHWTRRQDGKLREINAPPVEHYGLSEPLDWLQPRPVVWRSPVSST